MLCPEGLAGWQGVSSSGLGIRLTMFAVRNSKAQWLSTVFSSKEALSVRAEESGSVLLLCIGSDSSGGYRERRELRQSECIGSRSRNRSRLRRTEQE